MAGKGRKIKLFVFSSSEHLHAEISLSVFEVHKYTHAHYTQSQIGGRMVARK